MPVDLTFGAALIVGLLGSSHCLGMCGGIVSALNMGIADNLGARPRSIFGYQLAYNMGRIGSYVLVGLAAGSLGAGLAKLGVSPLAGRLFAAFFMVALGLYLANWWRGLALLDCGYCSEPVRRQSAVCRNRFQRPGPGIGSSASNRRSCRLSKYIHCACTFIFSSWFCVVSTNLMLCLIKFGIRSRKNIELTPLFWSSGLTAMRINSMVSFFLKALIK